MDESSSLDALAGLLEQLADNPRDFSVHVQHIRLAKSLEGLEAEAASASALEMFTNCFAAGDEVWLELLDIKERSVNLDTVNGIEEILALYQRAEADYLSIPVLKRHIEFILRRYEHYSDEAIKPDELGELFSKEWTRTAVTDIVNKGIGHITQSHLLWNLLRDWELGILESSSASEKPSLVEHLEAFLLERLSQPHAHADDTFQAYSSFTTNYKPASQYESLLVAASKVKSRIQKAVERRDPHEDALNRSRNSLEAFERYIAYERKAKYPDLAITSAVYERAISEAAKRKFQGEPGSEEALRAFWVGYSDALRLLNTGEDLQVDLFKRAVRSVPECGEIWARYIRCIERYTDPEHMKEERNVVSALFVQACEVPQLLQNIEQLVALILARAGFEKRLIDLGLSDDETIPTLIGILESGIDMVRKTQSGDPRLRLENYLVELYRFAGVPESSVAVWQLAVKHYKNSYFVWTSYTDCLIKTDRHDEAPWSLFEHFHGSVEQIEACLDKIEKARYQVNIRRLKEAEKANHLAMQVIAESQAAPAPVSELVATAPTEDSMEVDVANGSRGTKRAAEDTTDENSHKKTKLEPPPAPLKRDRENSTVFVADIPNNVTEEELTNVFKDCGRVREVKITKLSSATVATVEFMDRESVPAALTKDKKKISEQEIAVHLAWQSTLYVTNFPENADDSYIRNLFGKYGTIFDVRWPSKKFKNTRRFCYVQFTSPTSAQASLELHGQELEPDRVINVLISNPGRKKERTDQDANDRELHVAGLSKQTTKHDLQKLFTKFGPVKDIRMAMDNDGKFRGFAFVEFENESHARAALDANNQELKGRRMAITIADSRGKSRPRTFDTERGLGRNAELASRSIRVKNLPVSTQEGVLQQMFEKFVSVKRLELFEDVNEAVVELESPADVGKLLLQPEPITFNGASLRLIAEVPAPRKPDGIGYMIARGLAANGAKVYITGRRADVLQRVVDTTPKTEGEILALPMDVTSKDSILQAKREIETKEGKLHILVNNAGQVGPTSPFLTDPNAPEVKDGESFGSALFKEDQQGWSDLYSINVFSIFFTTTAFLGLLEKGTKESNIPGYTSSVINITSISGVIKLAQDHFCYNSAKAAASHLTKMLSTEFALKKIPVRVNSIAPGVYASEMTTDTISAEEVDKIGKGITPVPAQRDGSAEEMAGTAVYLASKAGCYMNGQELIIDGGYCAVNPAVV
ncbi:rna-binding protein prp24 [Lentinula edodes]|uniref:U4/U6 snRNA-associated-splicing factor PRP24 n=1 Tax=Lentinula edodes TaxID=5353 RepID=A0A1Q3EH31_LENED|nr:rna-binding protein prp24 [Lentinula edodes]